MRSDGGAVDQRVDASEVVGEFIQSAFDGGDVGNIQALADTVDAIFLVREKRETNLRAAGRERPADFAPDDTRSTENDAGFSAHRPPSMTTVSPDM